MGMPLIPTWRPSRSGRSHRGLHLPALGFGEPGGRGRRGCLRRKRLHRLRWGTVLLCKAPDFVLLKRTVSSVCEWHLKNVFVMELDCIQLSPTVPVPPRRQLATGHIGAFTSNRGITALVPARLHQNVSKHEKGKGGGVGFLEGTGKPSG